MASEDAPAATAAPIIDPASPILVDRNRDVAAAKALAITAAKETLSKGFFLSWLLSVSAMLEACLSCAKTTILTFVVLYLRTHNGGKSIGRLEASGGITRNENRAG